MKQVDPEFLTRSREVFASIAGISLQEIRSLVAREPAGTRRRDSLSALDSLSRVLKRPLEDIPASPQGLREAFTRKSATELGLTAKRWANVRSEVTAAVRRHGEPLPAITKRIPLSTEWSQLLETVTIKHHRMGLYRLAAYSTAMRIAPREVDTDTLRGFHAALEAEEVVKDPRKLLKHTIALWNMCRRRVPAWPAVALSSPHKVESKAFVLDSFPQSFQRDVSNWIDRVTHPDPLDPSAPRRPLRPATVKQRVYELRRFASALVHRGELTLDQVTSLDVLFDPARFKSGIRYFLQLRGNQSSPNLAMMIRKLCQLAKHYCQIDGEAAQENELLCRRLETGFTAGQMSDRNRERLRQYDDPANVARLLAFPAEERGRGRKLSNPIRAARCMERALAIEILIKVCLRIQNLRTIHLTRNLRLMGGRTYLSFSREEVKNSRELNFELPDDLAGAIQEFRTTYRHQLPGAKGPYLFPGKDAGPKSHNAMRSAIEETLLKNAGLTMHPHLFRHAMAKILVERNPELYPAVSQHLGHSRLDMTMAHYLGTETRASARHLDRLLRQTAINPALPRD